MTIPPEAILDFSLCPQDLQKDANLSIISKTGAHTLNFTLRNLGGHRYIHEHYLENNFSAGLRKRALPIWGYYTSTEATAIKMWRQKCRQKKKHIISPYATYE